MKILIIDDEKDICFLLKKMLEPEKNEVLIGNSIADYHLLKNKFLADVIFLDNNLPDGSGIELIKQINQEFPSIKVIIISAFDGKVERELADKNGAYYFIGKPFYKEIILDVLATI